MKSNNILRLPAVQKATGLSRATIYRLMAQNKFPASISLGERAIGWVEYEVQSWILNKIEASRYAEK